MPESDASKLVRKMQADPTGGIERMADDHQTAQAQLQVEIEGEPDIYALSLGDRKEYRFRDDETHVAIRDPNHPIWKRLEGDSRLRLLQRSYPGARIAHNDQGECLHVGEDLVMAAIPKALKEEREAQEAEATRAYIARNPILAMENGFTIREVEDLQAKYRDDAYLAARDSEFELEDRRAIARRAALARAQSEMARRTRSSPTSGMTYYEAETMYKRRIRNQLAAKTGREPNSRQIDEAYDNFVNAMETEARRGNQDNYQRDWKGVVARARQRSEGMAYAIGETGLGETTQQKVRRRQGQGG